MSNNTVLCCCCSGHLCLGLNGPLSVLQIMTRIIMFQIIFAANGFLDSMKAAVLAVVQDGEWRWMPAEDSG